MFQLFQRPRTWFGPIRTMPVPQRLPARCEPLEKRVMLSTVPSGFAETQIATNLSSPTSMTFAPDGRLFVCQQGGALRVIKNNTLLTTPFMQLNVDSAGERGLLGVAFDPSFNSNHFLYCYYTAKTPVTHNRISRFTANGDVVAAGSEKVIFELDALSTASNHNGGALHFGSDGKLYAAVGENANGSNSQTLSNVLGKMLRINSDGSIPTDNPFYGRTTGNNRAIWALGLRNPFTFAFQPGTTRMFINDVGQNTWEEVNDGIAGSNYGWPTTEGPTSDPRFRGPLYAYDHSQGIAITGGTFYNPSTQNSPSSYVGKYFFSDLGHAYIKVLDPSTRTANAFATNVASSVDLDVASDGSLYYLARGDASVTPSVFRIRFTASQAPSISAQPQSQTITSGRPVTFSVSANGTAPLSYQWQRNQVNIAGATGSSYTIGSVSAGDNGVSFRAIVSNSFGGVASNGAVLTVTANQPPVANITSPAAGSIYNAGQTISYSGAGSDPEDGAEPASRFTWQVDFHHADHIHPFIGAFSGVNSGTFRIPDTGETAANVFYRIILTVRDSSGLTRTVTRDVNPRVATTRFATDPAGLKLTLDGQPISTPTAVLGVVGMKRTLGVVTNQTLNGVTYDFARWSDGGAQTHTIATPATDTTYAAAFTARSTANGLSAVYYNNIDFTGTTVSRIDPTINFNWVDGSPSPSIGADTFSARWTGQVRADKSETYTFYTTTDDGVRLWVNGKLIIDQFHNKGAVNEYSGSIALAAAQRYDIRLDYYENLGKAYAQLRWSSPSTPKAIVPAGNLFPTAAAARSLSPLADAYVRGGVNAGINYGASPDIDLKLGADDVHREAYFKFDLSSVGSINSAKLRLWGAINGTNAANIPIAAYAVGDTSWTESGINWNNSRSISTGSTALSIVTITNSVARWYEWDVTTYLKQEKAAGRNVVALVLKSLAASNPLVRFSSDEAATNRPVLAVS